MIQQQPSNSGKHFPWYKERLKWKYIKNLDDKKLSCSRWQFLPRDTTRSLQFRDKFKDPFGYPTAPAAVYNHKLDYNIQQSATEQPTQSDNLLAKHLESLPPHLYEEVMQILDPSVQQYATTDEVDGGSSVQMTAEDGISQPDIAAVNKDDTVADSQEDHDHKTIYRFPLKKTKHEEYLEASKDAEQSAISPEQEKAVDTVMEELVDWINKLGDNSSDNHISESSIKKLFASDYEAKPVLTAPIHVMELLSNVPQELHSGFTPSFEISGLVKNDHLPTSVKSKYGAWYLDVRLWKYRSHDEPLQDPKELDKLNDTARKAKNLMLDSALLDTHSAPAFKEFVVLRKESIPRFLRNVGQTSASAVRRSKKKNN